MQQFDQSFVMDVAGYQNHPARIGVSLLEREGSALMVLTELPENEGTSVTNNVESYATEVYRRYLSHIASHKVLIVEHYPSHPDDDPPRRTPAGDFDLVRLDYIGGQFRRPRWSPLERYLERQGQGRAVKGQDMLRWLIKAPEGSIQPHQQSASLQEGEAS